MVLYLSDSDDLMKLVGIDLDHAVRLRTALKPRRSLEKWQGKASAIFDKDQSFFSHVDDKLELQNALRAMTKERIEA
jgi:hypothetical protein